MKKYLLLFISVLCLGLCAYADTVSFANGKPTDWDNTGTVAKQTRVNKSCLQLQKGASITSPEYTNVASIKLELNISANASTLTVEQTTNGGTTWVTLGTVQKADCATNAWREFSFNTEGDTSNGVKFKLTSATASYYIATFEYITAGEAEKENPDLKWIDYSQLLEDELQYGLPITEKSVKLPEAEEAFGYLYVTTAKTTTTGSDPIYSALTFTSSNPEVARFDDETDQFSLTAVGVGTTTLTANFPGDATYAAGKATLKLTITDVPGNPVVQFGNITANEDGEYTVDINTRVTVTSDRAEYIVYSNSKATDEMVEGNTYSFLITESDMYEFYGMNDDGESEHILIDFTVEKPVGTGLAYSLVKSTSELNEGELYTIGCAEKGTVMSNAAQDNYRQYVADVTFTDGTFDIKDNMLAFTLEQTEDGWKMLTANYAPTTNGEFANNYFNVGTAAQNYLTVKADAAEWTIDIDDETFDASITTTINQTTKRTIYYNSSTPRFATYTSKGNNASVQLYRETVIAPTLEVDGVKITAAGDVDLKAGSVIRFIGHEANELHYIHNTSNGANRAPSANTEGWTSHNSNIYEYVVEPDFADKNITISAKGVNNGKESAAVSISLTNGSTTGIECVAAESEAAEAEWYTIDGVRINTPAEGGLYIRRQGSKVEKVIL